MLSEGIHIKILILQFSANCNAVQIYFQSCGKGTAIQASEMWEYSKLYENLFLQYSLKIQVSVLETKGEEASWTHSSFLLLIILCLHRVCGPQNQINCYLSLYLLHSWRQERYRWHQSWRVSLSTRDDFLWQDSFRLSRSSEGQNKCWWGCEILKWNMHFFLVPS